VSGVPMTVPAANVQLAPAQYRNSTWATPERASLALASIWASCFFVVTVAPLAGAVIATLGPALSGVTVKLLLAVRPEPLVAVTDFAPEALAPALQL
jgi:hypothetical protein